MEVLKVLVNGIGVIVKANLAGIHELRRHLIDLLGRVNDRLDGLLVLARTTRGDQSGRRSHTTRVLAKVR